MGTMVETDIDKFIRGHKAKLQQDKDQLERQTGQGQGGPSPTGRKQWDHEGGRDARPVEQQRPPHDRRETGGGVPLGTDTQEQRKKQLNQERQRDYNDMIAKNAPPQKRKPATPRHEGLPLGQYENKKKELERERNREMQQVLAQQKETAASRQVRKDVFDYNEVKKRHLEEKKHEYKDFVLQKEQKRQNRKIITPESGFFVGPDQSERDQMERRKKFENKKAVEKQMDEQLLARAREMGFLNVGVKGKQPQQQPQHQQPENKYPSKQNNNAPPGYVERVLDMPHVTHADKSPREERLDDRHRANDLHLDLGDNADNDYDRGRRREKQRDYVSPRRQDDQIRRPQSPPRHRSNSPVHDKRPSPRLEHSPRHRSLSPRDRGPRERSRSPVQGREMRKSFSPRDLRNPLYLKRESSPADREAWVAYLDKTKQGRPVKQGQYYQIDVPIIPQEPEIPLTSRKQEQERIRQAYDITLAQKKQALQEEYNRTVAEEERRAAHRGPDTDLDYADRRHNLEKERHRDYQEYLATHPAPHVTTLRRKEVTPEDLRLGLGLDQARHDEERKVLDTERKEEYQKMMYEKQLGPGKKMPPTPEEVGLNLGERDQGRRQLEEQRNREYNELIAKEKNQHLLASKTVERDSDQKKDHPRRAYQEGTAATLPVGEYDVRRKQQLEEERHNEYLQHQQQKQLSDRHRGLPPKPQTPNHFFKKMGEHDSQAEKLKEERKREYNQRLAKRGEDLSRPTTQYDGKNPAMRGRTAAQAPILQAEEEYQASVPIKGHDSAEIRKVKQRNQEYNVFLREKKDKEAHRLDHKKPPTARHGKPPSPGRRADKNKDTYATLPGLHYSDSAEKTKVKQRNKEYNQYLSDGPPATRKGWQTPTYEEILDQKRRDEASRRQSDDDGPRMRAYASDGALNRLSNDLTSNSLDKEFDARKVRFQNDRQLEQGILDDDNWLNPEGREEEYNRLDQQNPVVERQPDVMATQVQRPGNFLSSLPVGENEGQSAKRRKQSEYRKELQLQMQETAAARKREKIQDLRVNATGLLDPEKSSKRMRGLGGDPGAPSPRREYKAKQVEPYHTKFIQDEGTELESLLRQRDSPSYARGQGLDLGLYNEYSGDSLQLDLGGLGGGGGRSRFDGAQRSRRNRDAGILETGFQGLLESRRNVGVADAPPGLYYQPTTYATGANQGGAGYSAVDEAYRFYAMKDPLDVAGSSGGLGMVDYGGQQQRMSPPPRVTFADEQAPISHRKRDRSQDRISPYHFSEENNRSQSQQGKVSYQQELERQIAERRYKKQKEKEEQERYERKLEEDIKNYNPFGRGGGGAPVRDSAGRQVADLRTLRQTDDTYQSPRRQQSPPRGSPRYSPSQAPPRDDLIGPPPQQQNSVGENTYARGGHGIFGMPKTEAEKGVTDKYKDELRQQIEDKRRREQMIKDKERMEEEKENRLLEDQRKRMQEEHDEEQKKVKGREEETRRKNEELKRQAEDRKKDQDRQKREVEDTRMRDQQEQLNRERDERQRQELQRGSPPVSALKVKQGWSPSHEQHHQYNYYVQTREEEEPRMRSPPLPAHRAGKETPEDRQPSPRGQPVEPIQRSNSSDVLTQLATMRKQLQNERRRVENALENSKNEPDVFDARVIQKPPAHGAFDKAMNKNAALPPPRATTSDMANARNLQQFNEHKFSDTESRRAFRSMFPDAPITNTTLEAQQSAMLRQQDDQLTVLKDKNPFEQAGPSNTSYGRHGNTSARSQLQSNSAFIDVDGVNGFPDDFEDLPAARNNSARARRRDRYPPSPRPSSIPNGYGSQASLDVDNIQRKNDDRLRRLQQMTGDNTSLGDPDDILERFMAKQRYNRPASGQTLQDDSWMRPGSKVV